MAGDFICLEKQFGARFKPNPLLSQLHVQGFFKFHKATHRDAFSVRYSRTSCNLAEEGNWRFWGTWLHAAQFFWKQWTAGYSCAAGCTGREKNQLDKPFVQLQTCRCRVHPRRWTPGSCLKEHMHCGVKSVGLVTFIQTSRSVRVCSVANLVAILKTSVAQAATETKIKLRHQTTTA